MKWIDLRNVVQFGILLLLSILASTVATGWVVGYIAGGISFLVLSGRVLTHGMDLSKNGPEWRPYLFVNLLFNLLAAIVSGSVFLVM